MKDGSKVKQKPAHAYRIETKLPMDLAMELIKDSLKNHWSFSRQGHGYRISSEQLHDTIYFEILVKTYTWRSKKVITGTIRELDKLITVIECDVRIPGPFDSVFARYVLALYFASLLSFVTGAIVFWQLALIWIGITLVFRFLLSLGNRIFEKEPDIERIAKAVEPHEVHRNLIERREQAQNEASANLYPSTCSAKEEMQ
ncbi:MAG: hypothetical protein OXG60_07720 [Chloroflexi bacterium]|nr:hypothetical protein [Chloroflexota bacterium]